MRWILALALIAAAGVLWVSGPGQDNSVRGEEVAVVAEAASTPPPRTSSLDAPPSELARQVLESGWRAARQLSFEHSPSSDGQTSLTIGFRCPEGWIEAISRVSIEAEEGHGHGFEVSARLPGEAVFARNRPGMGFWSSGCWPPCGSLVDGDQGTSFVLRLNSVPVPDLAPILLQPGHGHRLELELGNWASATLVLCQEPEDLPAWAGSIWYRPDRPREEWISLDPPSKGFLTFRSSGHRRRANTPIVPAGRYEFLAEGPWKGARIRWTTDLATWGQEVPVPFPDTKLRVWPPKAKTAEEARRRRDDTTLWVCEWNGEAMAPKSQPSLRNEARLPKLTGSNHRFLPAGRHQILAHHAPTSLWAILRLDLSVGSVHDAIPDWSPGGSVELAVEHWKWADGARGRLVLVHVDTGWQSQLQWMRQDPAAATFHDLPQGSYQACWGEPDRGPQRGFSDVFEVKAGQPTAVYFPTTPDGGGVLAEAR